MLWPKDEIRQNFFLPLDYVVCTELEQPAKAALETKNEKKSQQKQKLRAQHMKMYFRR